MAAQLYCTVHVGGTNSKKVSQKLRAYIIRGNCTKQMKGNGTPNRQAIGLLTNKTSVFFSLKFSFHILTAMGSMAREYNI